MALNLIDFLLNSGTFRIIDNIQNVVMDIDIKIINARIRLSAELLTNEDELGRPVVDGRFTKPIEITVTSILNTDTEVQKLNQIFLNKKTTYNIVTRGLVFNNFYLINSRDLQDSSILSGYPFDLVFRQILIPQIDQQVVADYGDASTLIGGIKQPIDKSAAEFRNVVSNRINDIESMI